MAFTNDCLEYEPELENVQHIIIFVQIIDFFVQIKYNDLTK